jgi:ABC-type amino acid transport system permease subunit
MQASEHLVVRKRVALILGASILVLLGLHVAVNLVRITTGHGDIMGLIPLFDFWLEQNVPTLFSTLILVAASALLYYVHVLQRQRNAKASRHWVILSCAFLYLAVDEFAELHEKLSKPTQTLSGFLPGSFEHWGWVLPYALLVLVAIAYFLPFYFRLPRRFQVYFAVAAVAYVGGALGCEVLEGMYQAVSHKDLETARGEIPFVLLVSIEEVLEMGGVSLLIYALLEYIEGITPTHVFKLKR